MDRTGSLAVLPYLECGVSIRKAVPIPICLLGGRQFLKIAEKLSGVGEAIDVCGPTISS